MPKTPHTQNSLAVAFQRLRPRLLAAGKRLLGDADEASDAVQETFVRLWCANADANEGTMVTAMRNTCIDTLRRRRPTTEVSDVAETVTTDTSGDDAAELYDRVSRTIESCLSERDRSILIMRDRDGFEMDAIASRTGLSEANVRLILSRARKAVRMAYQQRYSTNNNTEK